MEGRYLQNQCDKYVSKKWVNAVSLYSREQINSLCRSIESQSREVELAIEFIDCIKDKKWDKSFEEKSGESKLFKSLNELRSVVKEVWESEEKRTWISTGLLHFNDLIKKRASDMRSFSDLIISYLVKYLKANQGAIFLHDKGTGLLNGASFFGYGKKKYIERTFSEDQGLIGECFMSGETILLTDVPSAYYKITSGLGESLPRSIILIPIKSYEEKLGVIELASFHHFQTHEKEFLKRISENVATLLLNMMNSERTKQLLAQEENITKTLRLNEEKLLRTIDELKLAQFQMARQNSELEEAKRIIEEKKNELEERTRNEMELIESKLKTQEEIHQTVIKKLQSRIKEQMLAVTINQQ